MYAQVVTFNSFVPYGGVMVLNATFNNISVISWGSVFIGGGNRRKLPTCRTSLTSFITLCWIEYTSARAGFELKILEVIGADCTGSCKFNFHTITTTTALYHIGKNLDFAITQDVHFKKNYSTCIADMVNGKKHVLCVIEGPIFAELQ